MLPILSEAFVTAFLVAVIANTVPLMLAAVGETVGEQSGVLNLGLEGLLLGGGFFAFAATLKTGSFFIGFLSGAVAGMLLSLILVALSVWLGLNQIVVGIGITLAGTGLTSMLYDFYYAAEKPRLGPAPKWEIPFLADIPYIGTGIFAQPTMLYLTLLIAALTSVTVYKTSPGLRLRAAGQNPAALDTEGGNVMLTRTLAVLFGGAMAGMGGAYLALISAGSFTPVLTQGMGFLAVVVAMLARGKQSLVLVVSLGYGIFVAAGTALQLTTVHISNDVISALPFIAVMVVLTLFPKSSSLPGALAVPYHRGAR